MIDLETFILIGGHSTRFGSDKAFFEFEGESLAARSACVAHIAHPGVSVRFIAVREGQFGGRSAELNDPTVFDRRPGLGAWSGFDTALANSSAEWTLLLACDLPFVSTSLLERLVSNAEEQFDAVVPRDPDGRLQPLCAVYRTKATRAAVTQIIDTSEPLPPVRTLVERLRSNILDVDDDSLRNVNSPADLR